MNDYLSKRITLRELESWLVPRLRAYLDAPDSAVGRLAGAVELNMAELQAGLKSERTVRMALSRYVDAQKEVWTSFQELQREVIESREVPGDWRVEDIDYLKDGQIYIKTFSGPDARLRAEEYAENRV